MLSLERDEASRERLRAASNEQVAKFDWKRSAASLLELYEEAVATPKRGVGA
jgi:alpha-1,3-rhamnosyl/mannosyltransferase